MFELLMTTATCSCHPKHPRQLSWVENPDNEFDPTENNLFTRYINAHFIDIEKGVEAIQETTVDAKLPYDRILPTNGEWLTSTRNHMVRRASCRGDVRMSSCARCCFVGAAGNCFKH